MKNLLTLFLISLFVLGQSKAYSQNKIKWLTWEQAMIKSKTDKKKILVNLFTPWCSWCKKMEKSTYADDEIATYINQHYYAVKFNAESQEDVTINGKKYGFVKYGVNGYNELASELLQGHLSYPSTVFLNENFEPIQAIPGFQEGNTFAMIITYFATNSHKSIPWNRYTQQFERAQMGQTAGQKN